MTARDETRAQPAIKPARVTSPFVRLFSIYVRRYLGRHFHGVRLAKDSFAPGSLSGPLVVFFNHPSWWDPLIALMLGNRFFRDRRHLSVIDAEAGAEYGILRRLGIQGVDRSSAAGARRFLEVAERALTDSDGVLWLTPQGRFVDVRDSGVEFESGLAHLARRYPMAQFVPLALEYPFWDERTPEALARFAAPCRPSAGDSSAAISRSLERALQENQRQLASASLTRDPYRFEPMIAGASGVGGIYDHWRRALAMVRGRRLDSEHSTLTASRSSERSSP